MITWLHDTQSSPTHIVLSTTRLFAACVQRCCQPIAPRSLGSGCCNKPLLLESLRSQQSAGRTSGRKQSHVGPRLHLLCTFLQPFVLHTGCREPFRATTLYCLQRACLDAK